MTHDERIEAVARAIQAEFGGYGKLFATYRDMAEAALAAAGVDEMVREAVRLGRFLPSADVEVIVREVMSK